jgi:hypothetical protein
MAVQSKDSAGASTGAPGETPAPVKQYDRTGWPRVVDPATTRPSSGQNQYGGASVIAPGERSSPNFLAQPFDPVLEKLIADGVTDDGTGRPSVAHGNDQLRALAAKNVPDHVGAQRRDVSSGSPGGTVPDKLGTSEYAPNKKP